MKRLSGKVDLSKWTLQAVEDVGWGDAPITVALRDVVLAAASEALTLALSDSDGGSPCLYFASSGESSDDPLSLVLTLPLGSHDISDPEWSFSLDESAASLVELICCAGHEDCLSDISDSCVVGVEDQPRVSALRDGLRALADKLDAVVKRSEEAAETV